MAANARILFDAGKKLLDEMASAANANYSPGTSSKHINDKVTSFIRGNNVFGYADNDLLKLIALAELERSYVQSKYINLAGVDPKAKAFELAFIGAISKRNLPSEVKVLITERVKTLKKMITHTAGMKTLGKTLLTAKTITGGLSSQPLINAEAIKKLDEICNDNIRIYQKMIERRKSLLTELG